jgi:hypothetical protein
MKKSKDEYGSWKILASNNDGFWCADRFYYLFRLDSARDRITRLHEALQDAAFQQDKYSNTDLHGVYCVVEI